MSSSGATGYPLLLQLAGRRVLVVGGGAVATRRGAACAAAGARVIVVSLTISPELDAVAAEVHRRGFRPVDVRGAWLVHACTDDAGANAEVAAACEEAGIWCVRADDAGSSAAHVPAVASASGVTVAVNAGADPGRAKAIRDAIALLLDTGELPLRTTRTRDGVGSVALVGGGPGDPGLITTRGRRLLAAADVVLVDRLAPRALLESLAEDVLVLDAGKSPHAHNLTQDEINAALVAHALDGKRVVRLKGGDPFVFGRGGEEALACVAAGVPFEVVPGVTSAVAVPAYAGIPVTHRGLAQDFSVISAHLDPAAAGSTVDWASLARTKGTLVLLMAVDRLPAITAALVEGGRPASTPVAVICSGTTDDERVLVATLADVADRALADEIRPPAVVVVGEVVALRDRIKWR